MKDLSDILRPYAAGRRRQFCCHSATLSGRFPANSLAAVVECVGAEVPRLEIDVRFLADDTMLIYHDSSFAGRGDGAMRVADATMESARLERDEHGESIPVLEEVVDVMAGSKTVLQVDLKLTRPITDQRVDKLTKALRPLGDRVLVGSQAHWNLRKLDDVPVAFDPTLHWVQSASPPGLPRTLGVHGLWDDSPIAGNPRFTPEEYVEARIDDLVGLVPRAVEWMVDIGTTRKFGDLGISLGDRLAKRGVALAAWTLSGTKAGATATVSRLFELGVETVIADVPEPVARLASVNRL